MGTRGEETVEAVAAGGYRTADGSWVSIAAAVAAAVAGNRQDCNEGHRDRRDDDGRGRAPGTDRYADDAALLCFGEKPRGGFLGNAKAQEEDLVGALRLPVRAPRLLCGKSP